MRHRQALFARSAVLASLLALVISPGTNGVAATDVTAPAAIGNLAAVAPLIAPQLHTTLTWTAPGDDGNTGTATSYDIRFRTDAPLTEANWGSATQVTYGMDPSRVPALVSTEPAPQPSGTLQSFTVVGLKPNKRYYWAIKTVDDSGNISGISNSVSLSTAKYEGYGYQSVGGGEQPFCEVTSLALTGAGSISACIGDNKYVVFSVGGTILVNTSNALEFNNSHYTIDGSTAPPPGITFATTNPILNEGLMIGARDGAITSHQIVTYLRFKGLNEFPPYQGTGPCTDNPGCHGSEDVFSISGYKTGATTSHMVVDHVTTEYAEDSAMDLAGDASGTITDVTISNSFLWRNAHAVLVDTPARARITWHHNLWSENMDRAPYFQVVHTDIEIVNNLYFWNMWDPSGSSRQYRSSNLCLNLRGTVDINILNNYFIPFPCTGISGCVDRANRQLTYGDSPGWDAVEAGTSYTGCKKQGTIWTAGAPMSGASVWVAGNVFPAANCDEYSTVSSPRPTPSGAQITTDLATTLWATVLPTVGTFFRTSEEQSLIDSASAALHSGGICGNNIKEPGETCDGSDVGGATCVSQGYAGGSLRCSSNCLSFDTSQCVANGAPGDVLNLRRTDTNVP